MIQRRVFYYIVLLGCVLCSACSKDDDPVIEPPASGAIIDPNVGGANQPNQVFIDLSTNKQTVVGRNTWDLGFYSGSDFRVILNNSVSALARSLDKSDLSSVIPSDTIGFGGQLDIDAIFSSLFGAPPSWLSEASSWLDAPSGDLSKTAIEAISSNNSDNKVYILNRGKNPDGTKKGWMKIRVLQNNGQYILRYAEINSTSYNELTIPKNSDYDFVHVSLDNGIVSSSPKKNDWDFAFTVFTNLLPVGGGTAIPYAFKDFIVSNVNRIEIATVEVNSNVTYDNFSFGSVGGLEFTKSISAIGSGWRTVAQPGSNQQTGVKSNVFFVIKDTSGNFYKLRFTRLVDASSGERGNPQFQYNLLTE